MTEAPTSPKPSKPTRRQALVMLGGGTLLASSACYGVFESEATGSGLANAFSALFVVGLVMALVGVILVIVLSAKAPAVSDVLSPAPRPTWRQGLIMLASGAVLGASSCYGFLEMLGKKGPMQILIGPFATGFYVGCLVALGGLIMLLIRAARSLMRRRT